MVTTSFFSQAFLSVSDVLSHLNTSETTGLTQIQANKLIKKNGKNVVIAKKPFALLFEFVSSFFSPLILLLIAASLISAFTGQLQEFFVISAIIFVSGLVSFFQHFQADKASEKLKQKVRLTTTVIRDGKEREIPFSEITIGDIVLLSVGDLVPADGRIITAKDFLVDESTLTGESFPREKSEHVIAPTDVITKISNMVFMGTHILSGEAKIVVTAIGRQTSFGKVSVQIQQAKPQTAFDKNLSHFGFVIMKAALFLAIGVFCINALLHHNFLSSFLFALALAVGLTPELLPIILTINLAKGAVKMEKKEVIVKFLPAIQNLGGMDVLCTDKTGTLTENDIILQDYVNGKGEKDEDVLLYAYVNSLYHTGFKNPLDAAILAAKEKEKATRFEKIDEIPFDFERKRLSVIVKDKKTKKLLCITKGSPHQLFSILKQPAPGARQIFEKKSREGFRIVAIATKVVKEEKSYDTYDEKDMQLAGFLYFYDPPKKTVVATLKELEHFGITLKILTGDNEFVTRHVCESIQLPVKDIVLGHEVEALTISQLQKRVESATIFARLSPDQKAKIIEALKNNGHTVGYMGDGINDAPPLKRADVGISVNNGSDIARDVSDIILMRKSLLVLQEGVKEGRKTFANILKYLMMGSSSNLGNMITVAFSSFLLPFLPMLPSQILLNNLFYDTSQLTLPGDAVDAEFIAIPRKWVIAFIKRFMMIFGPISSLFDFLTFFVLLYLYHASSAFFQTGWFVESLFTQTIIVFAIRTRKVPFFKSKPSILLTLSSLGVGLTSLLLPFLPFRSYFSFVSLPLSFYFFVFGVTAMYFFVVDSTKKWFYR